MKTILLTILLTGCVQTTQSLPPNRNLDEGFYNPPNTTTFTVRSNHRTTQPNLPTEQDTYLASLNRIVAVITDESSTLQACKTDCASKRTSFCQTAQLIDSRGGIHQKPYCQESK
jgi:hypothetical protein